MKWYYWAAGAVVAWVLYNISDWKSKNPQWSWTQSAQAFFSHLTG